MVGRYAIFLLLVIREKVERWVHRLLSQGVWSELDRRQERSPTSVSSNIFIDVSLIHSVTNQNKEATLVSVTLVLKRIRKFVNL